VKRFRLVAGCVALLLGAIAMLELSAGEATPQSVYAFGAPFYGSTGLVALNEPISGMAARPDGKGYWTVTRNGEVSPFGAATWYGSLTSMVLQRPIVGMAATPSGKGYWLVSSDGGVFSFGDATFAGSLVGVVGPKAVVGIAADPTGNGYWLVTGTGTVYDFGSAASLGSADGVPLNGPIVGIAPTATGDGYWLAGRDGGVFSFGDAGYFGSLGATPLDRAAVGIARTAGGHGYFLVSSDGGVFSFGDAVFHGSLGNSGIPEPAVAMAVEPGGGYWVALTGHLAPASSPRLVPSYLNEGSNAIGASAAPATTYRQVAATPGCAYTVTHGDASQSLGGGSGRNVVHLTGTDTAFDSQGCGQWSTDLFPATASIDSSVGDGTWLLGIDIRSGTWTAPGGAGCTWSTKKDLTGAPVDTIASGGGAGPQSVPLAGSEVAFVSQGCGNWTPS
jgi:hypothetical protein